MWLLPVGQTPLNTLMPMSYIMNKNKTRIQLRVGTPSYSKLLHSCSHPSNCPWTLLSLGKEKALYTNGVVQTHAKSTWQGTGCPSWVWSVKYNLVTATSSKEVIAQIKMKWSGKWSSFIWRFNPKRFTVLTWHSPVHAHIHTHLPLNMSCSDQMWL